MRGNPSLVNEILILFVNLNREIKLSQFEPNYCYYCFVRWWCTIYLKVIIESTNACETFLKFGNMFSLMFNIRSSDFPTCFLHNIQVITSVEDNN